MCEGRLGAIQPEELAQDHRATFTLVTRISGGEEGVEGSKEFKEIKADFFFSKIWANPSMYIQSLRIPIRSDAEPRTQASEQNCQVRGQRKPRQREKAGDRTRRVQ